MLPFIIPQSDGLYSVTPDGRVFSRLGCRGAVLPVAHELGQCVRDDGYRCVNVKINGRFRNFLVHRLIAEAYLERPPHGVVEVRHLDGDKGNNSADNLAWGTRADNEADKVLHGRSNRGSRQGRSKLTEDVVRHIRATLVGAKRKEVVAYAKSAGCSYTAVYDVLSGRTWSWLI